MTTQTPGGRFLGRKRDKADTRDHLFVAHHPEESKAPLLPAVDLEAKLPPAFDQGNLGSCGLNSADAVMCFFYGPRGYSRLQAYYDVRVIEDTVREDSGVECRDVMRVLQLTGMAPENLWPYDIKKFRDQPPVSVYQAAEQFTVERYSRLVTGDDMLRCLSAGFPFILGIELTDFFDSDQLARTGIVPATDPAQHEMIGGHAVTAIGYDLNFKNNAAVKAANVDPATVTDRALKIRNSWGTAWGIRGHFWLPLPYATNRTLGCDAWTARMT